MASSCSGWTASSRRSSPYDARRDAPPGDAPVVAFEANGDAVTRSARRRVAMRRSLDPAPDELGCRRRAALASLVRAGASQNPHGGRRDAGKADAAGRTTLPPRSRKPEASAPRSRPGTRRSVGRLYSTRHRRARRDTRRDRVDLAAARHACRQACVVAAWGGHTVAVVPDLPDRPAPPRSIFSGDRRPAVGTWRGGMIGPGLLLTIAATIAWRGYREQRDTSSRRRRGYRPGGQRQCRGLRTERERFRR